ncbi:hypothetical protein DFH06DRAFT_1484394 [Mycena polygramma]|nr:hypothetical protein DFH06DRAFT_1485709 [Mycena polygramma]KAJ7614311.1 hypothetical protein DFH06DRAFT_1484394 [Mycena polygramma]
MVFIACNNVKTSSEVAVTGVAFDDLEDTNPWIDCQCTSPKGVYIDGFDDTNPWTDCVSLSSQMFPTPIAKLDLSPLSGTVDVVWMGNVERLEVSASCVDASAVESLEVSTVCVDASAVEFKRLEMSRSAETLDNSAAERLEMSGLATVDNSAAYDSRSSRLLTDGGMAFSCAFCGELGLGTYLPKCRSKRLAAGPAPTLVKSDKVAEAVNGSDSRVARILTAGVETGPGETEGAHTLNRSGKDMNQNYFAMDWNDLLDTEDQLGPLPCWISSATMLPPGYNGKDTLPVVEYGHSQKKHTLAIRVYRDVPALIMDTIYEESDNESIARSESIRGDNEPVIFCGMGRISVAQSKSSDSEQPKHRKKSNTPSNNSTHTVLPDKAERNRHNSSSKGRKINVKSFKRESSEIPEGGWFRATTAEMTAESSASSSDSSSDSSSSDNGTMLSSGRLRSARGVKIKNPCTYDGRADLDLFDQWTYEVDTWREWNGIKDRMAVKIVVNFMSGKASRFFMKHVALRQKEWTLKSIYEALFHYCFPPDFKLQLRQQLTGAEQGKNDVRDFQRDLETLAVRFPDVTEREIRQIFWNGIRGYLRLHLIGKGLNPERSSIHKLVKYASRHEAARKTLKRERKRWNYNLTPSVVTSTRAATDDESIPSATEAEISDESEGEARSVENTMESSEESEENKQPNQFRPQNFLPQQEYIRLRQEGRCFRCKKKGHLSQNCPEAEPIPPVEVLAARFADHEESDGSSEQNESEDDDIRSSEHALELKDTDEEDTSDFSEENFGDRYSDSSDESEYYVGAMRVELGSDRGHRLEGETETTE